MKIFFATITNLLIISSVFAQGEFIYSANDKRDPFVPLVSKDGVYVSDVYGIRGIKDIRLEGIVWEKTKGSIAIINGEIIKEGQEIGSLKVLKIERDAVIFDVNGDEVRIEFTIDRQL